MSPRFVTVLALTSCPSKFGLPHCFGHGLRLAGKPLPNPGRSLAKNSSGKPKLGWPGINASARHRDWCPGRTAQNWDCQAMIWLHLIKPACLQKLNSTHLESLYSTLSNPRLFYSPPRSALPQAAQCQGYPTAQSLLPPSPGKPSG